MSERDKETEARILEAAHRVFLRRGMSGARTQEIADEAGVNKALLHYYFRSKERLAQAVFRRAAGLILPRLHKIMASEEGIEEKVRQVIEAEVEVLRRHPYLPGYVIAEVNYHPELVLEVFAERGGAPPLGRLREQLRQEAEAGRIREISAEQFMANLVSLIFFPFVARPLLKVVLDVGDGFDDFLDERAATLGDFFLAGLRP